jgi:septum formation inhibitor-activating ATPase MinD
VHWEAILVTTPDITSLRDADCVTGLLECDRNVLELGRVTSEEKTAAKQS